MELKQCRVLVTPATFGTSDPRLGEELEDAVGEVVYNPFGRPLSASELAVLLRDIDGCIAGLDRFERGAIEAANRLRVIARYGVGVDAVDLAAAAERGIIVTNTPGANSAAVAELALALILCLARNICAADRATRAGEWPRFSGIGLRGKTVGLVGFGAVGKEVAARLGAFGCTVLASDPFVPPGIIKEHGALPASIDHLLGASDFVSLHAPLTPSTSAMVDRGFLAAMKRGAFLINTARGELVDEYALASALEDGRLAGAALDCFREEPPDAGHPLLKLPRVMITPHMGAHTDEAVSAMGWMSLRDCLAVLKGEKPQHPVNPDVHGK
ncbi:MAG: phosphoglycerate dehydrogenase [Syntrophobacteraceae bacterium]